VPAILFHIEQVVDQIDGARQQAKDGECRYAAQQARRIKDAAIEKNAGEYKGVLGPLSGAHLLEQGA
jgi:hypothetical protein